MDEIKEEIVEGNFNQFQTEIKHEQYEELSNDSLAKEDLEGNETCLFESILNAESIQDAYTDFIALNKSNRTCYKLRIQVSSSGGNECMSEELLKYEKIYSNDGELLNETKLITDDQKDFIHALIKKENDSMDIEENKLNENYFVNSEKHVLDNDEGENKPSSQEVIQKSLDEMDEDGTVKGIQRKKKFKCQNCDYAAAIKGYITSHNKAVHLKLKNFKCQWCDYAATRQGNLNKHINAVHLRLKNFKCNLCDYAAISRSTLKVHNNAVHLKLKNFKCQLCDYSATIHNAITIHNKAVHLKQKNFKCLLCNYASSSRSKLNEHNNAVHLKLKNLKCQWCDFQTNRRNVLTAHIKAIHLNLTIKCQKCDYTAKSRRYVNKHIKCVHSFEK